jgi:lipid A 3-O-deacylase
LTDFGFTPVLRYRGASKQGLFIELGVGANYFTKKYNDDGNQLASNFEFGDHVGLGYLFINKIELTLKFQHFSNAGIKEPNSGLNMGLIKIAYPF